MFRILNLRVIDLSCWTYLFSLDYAQIPLSPLYEIEDFRPQFEFMRTSPLVSLSRLSPMYP